MRFKPLNLDYHAEASSLYGILNDGKRKRPSLTVWCGRYEKNSTTRGSMSQTSAAQEDRNSTEVTPNGSPLEESESITLDEGKPVATDLCALSTKADRCLDGILVAKIPFRLESACNTKHISNEPWSENLRMRSWYSGNFTLQLWGHGDNWHLISWLPTWRTSIQPSGDDMLRTTRDSSPPCFVVEHCVGADMFGDVTVSATTEAPLDATMLSVVRSHEEASPLLPFSSDSRFDTDHGYTPTPDAPTTMEGTSCRELVLYVAPDRESNSTLGETRLQTATDSHQYQVSQSCTPSNNSRISPIPNETDNPIRHVTFSRDQAAVEQNPPPNSQTERIEGGGEKRDSSHMSEKDSDRAARKKAKRDKKKRKREQKRVEELSQLAPAKQEIGAPTRTYPPVSSENYHDDGINEANQPGFAQHAGGTSRDYQNGRLAVKPTPSTIKESLDPFVSKSMKRTIARDSFSMVNESPKTMCGNLRRSLQPPKANLLSLIHAVGAVGVKQSARTKKGETQAVAAGNRLRGCSFSARQRPSLFDDLSVDGTKEAAAKRPRPMSNTTKKQAESKSQDDMLLDDPIVGTSKHLFSAPASRRSSSMGATNGPAPCLVRDRKSATSTERPREAPPRSMRRGKAAARSSESSSSRRKPQFAPEKPKIAAASKLCTKTLSKVRNGGNVPSTSKSVQPLLGQAKGKPRVSQVNASVAKRERRVTIDGSNPKPTCSTTPSYYMSLVDEDTPERETTNVFRHDPALRATPQLRAATQPTVQGDQSKLGVSTAPSFYMSVLEDTPAREKSRPLLHQEAITERTTVAGTERATPTTAQSSREKTAPPSVPEIANIQQSFDNDQDVPSAGYAQQAVQVEDNTACLELLSTERFLESWSDVVADLGRPQSLDCSDSQNSPRIALLDSPLMNFSGVDVELPGRCGVLLFDASISLNTTAQAKAAVLDIARLAAIGRYAQIFVFVCVQGVLSTAIAKHMLQLQCAAVPAKGLPETQFSFQTLLRKHLAGAIATTAFSLIRNSNGLAAPQADLLRTAFEATTLERAIFLQSLVPVLSPSGALELLHMAKRMLPEGCPFFQILFKNQRVLQKIALMASSTERSSSIHPHAVRQLVRVARVATTSK